MKIELGPFVVCRHEFTTGVQMAFLHGHTEEYLKFPLSVNFSVDAYPSCCGATIIHNFYIRYLRGHINLFPYLNPQNKEIIINHIIKRKELTEAIHSIYTGNGILTAIAVVPSPMYTILTSVGFVDTGRAINPNSGSIIATLNYIHERYLASKQAK